MNIAEIEKEVLREKSRTYLARTYNVPQENVVFEGDIPNRSWRVSCTHSSSAVSALLPDDEAFIPTMAIVEMNERYRQLDNINNQANDMLVGQCPECGRVYFGMVVTH